MRAETNPAGAIIAPDDVNGGDEGDMNDDDVNDDVNDDTTKISKLQDVQWRCQHQQYVSINIMEYDVVRHGMVCLVWYVWYGMYGMICMYGMVCMVGYVWVW